MSYHQLGHYTQHILLVYLLQLHITGRSMDKIKADAHEKGDLGIVAEVLYDL